MDGPKVKSGDFIKQSPDHRLTCLKINQRLISNTDCQAQNQYYYKLQQRHSLSIWEA